MSCVMKRTTGKRNMTKPLQAVISSMLLLLCSSLDGCATKPVLNVGPDGRGCMVGIVDSTDAAILRAKNPAVHAGDILFTPFCASEVGLDVYNEIYELTR